MKRKGLSLFTKYYLTVGIGIVAVFLVLSVVIMISVSSYLTTVTTEQLNSDTQKVMDTVNDDIIDFNKMTDADMTVLQYTLDMFSTANDSDIVFVSPQGKVLVSGKNNKFNLSGAVLPDYIMKHYVADNDEDSVYTSVRVPAISSGKVVIISKTLRTGEYINGYIVAISAMETLAQSKEAILRILLLCTFIALTISVAVVYFLAYRTLKPLKQLSFATKKIASGDYSYRVDIDGDDEFRDLGDAFNDMAQSLSVLEESRRSFVANVSHELKTPMTTIGGFVDGIIDGTIPTDKQNEYLQVVSDEVKRLARLVVSMLDLSKIEAGELSLKFEEVDVSQMVFQVLLSFEQMIAKKQIEIRGLDSMSKMLIKADRDMLYQVFYNLVDNAVKFTDKDGYIAVTATIQDGKYIFRIKNKCKGISSSDMSKIFDRFYKVDKSHSRDVKGSGLGLYLTKKIVEMHAGQITVLSEEGSSCEFLFWIPANIGDFE